MNFDAFEGIEERLGVGDDFTAVLESDFEFLWLEMDGGLSGGAEDGGGVIVIGEFLDDAEARFEEIRRKALSLIEDDDGVGDVVKFAAA